MLVTILQILAGVSALAGLIALTAGPLSKSDATRGLCLRIVQGGMSLAGLVLIFVSFLSQGYEPAAGGLMLIVFGTAVTGFGRKRTKAAPQDKS